VASFNVKALLFGDPQAKKQKQAALQAELAAASSPAAKKFVSDQLVVLEAINQPG
jgi:2',3'-cyclic-nucleotide 2'-phosphodiesterase/3'-nucleotidase